MCVLRAFQFISHFILSLILQINKLRLRQERSLAWSCSGSRVLNHHSYPLVSCVMSLSVWWQHHLARSHSILLQQGKERGDSKCLLNSWTQRFFPWGRQLRWLGHRLWALTGQEAGVRSGIGIEVARWGLRREWIHVHCSAFIYPFHCNQ